MRLLNEWFAKKNRKYEFASFICTLSNIAVLAHDTFDDFGKLTDFDWF